MVLATLTSKGQVTVPKKVRDSLCLQAGDKVEFIITDNGGAFVRPVTKKVDEVFGSLHKPGTKPVSIKAMNAAIKRKMRKDFK